MTNAKHVLNAWAIDHRRDDETDVAAAVDRGHRLFLRWLLLRSVLAAALGAALVSGLVELRSLAVGSSVLSTAPTARLVVTPERGPEPLKVTVDASGSSPGAGAAITSIRFDLGDKTVEGPQPGPVIHHTYDDPGTYTVRVLVTAADGRSDEETVTVTVTARSPELPRAALKVRPDQGHAPLTVTADASSSRGGGGGKIKRYRFNFGDHSAVKTQKKATTRHTYRKAGHYRVVVRVVDAAGKSDRSSQIVVVTPKQRPIAAALTVKPHKGPARLTVQVDASASSAGTGATIRDYRFDFGDRSPTQAGSTARLMHTFAEAGSFRVNVTVTDSTGATAQDHANVTVTEPVPTRARLTVKPDTGPAPLDVVADATGSKAADGATIESYLFYFGEGVATDKPQKSAEAKHTFKKPGDYTVTLTLRDSRGATVTDTKTIKVEAEQRPPRASLVVHQAGTGSYKVTADASGSAPGSADVVQYTFDFGDGSVKLNQPEATAPHTYNSDRSLHNYTVQVTIEDANGLTDTTTHKVSVPLAPG